MRNTKGFLLGSAMLCMTSPVFAQTSAPAASEQVEGQGQNDSSEIIVTALKRSQNLQDVPATINAIGAEALKERQINSLEDLQSQVAGLKFDPIAGNSNIAIRGVGTTFTTGAGENSVSLHLDGVYLSSPRGAAMGQFDLGSVEVLRGPQGTLYGKNSTAGIVNFISAAPTNTFEAGLTLGYGNYDDKKIKAYVSGPLSDTVRARLYLEAGDRDGYTRNLTTGQDLDDLRQFSGRVAIDADVTSGWKMELRFTARNDDYNGPVFQPYRQDALPLPISGTVTTPRELNSPMIYDGQRNVRLLSVKNSFDIGDVTLVSLTGASQLNVKDRFDTLAQYNPTDPFLPSLSIPIGYDLVVKTASQEFNLKGKNGGLDWLLGAFYYYENQNLRSTVLLSEALLGAPPALVRVASGESNRNSASLFADGTLNLTDATRVFAGVRGIYERMTNDLLVTLSIANGGPQIAVDCDPSTPQQNVTDWSATGRVGIQHDVTQDVMVYGQASRGYKSGGFSNNTCRNQFKPETVNALEFGLKSQLFDRRLTLNASAYYYDYRNISVEQSTIFGTFVVNAPKSHVLGVDVDGRLAINDWWSVDGNATFLRTRYDRFFSSGGAAYGDPDGTDLSGRTLNKAPGASGTVGTTFKIPVGSGKLTLRGEGYFSAGYRLREYSSPIFRQKAYQLWNAYLTYDVNDNLTMRLYGKNLSKTNYLQGTVAELAGANAVFNPPRTYGVEATMKLF